MNITFNNNIVSIEKNNTTIELTAKEALQFVKLYTHEMKLAKVPNRTGSDDTDYYICPTCEYEIAPLDFDYEPKHCAGCGQKLDWKNAFNRGRVVKKKKGKI